MNRFIHLVKNKYFLVTLAFLIWMLFFDRNDLMSQYEYQTQLHKLQEEKEFYQRETEAVRKDLKELTTDMKQLEKFAREKYLMKKDDEDVFIIIKEEKETKKSLF
ncbi:MAG TPA: septum formation initiator family protein [Sphingobacteriaceae bacterium]